MSDNMEIEVSQRVWLVDVLNLLFRLLEIGINVKDVVHLCAEIIWGMMREVDRCEIIGVVFVFKPTAACAQFDAMRVAPDIAYALSNMMGVPVNMFLLTHNDLTILRNQASGHKRDCADFVRACDDSLVLLMATWAACDGMGHIGFSILSFDRLEKSEADFVNNGRVPMILGDMKDATFSLTVRQWVTDHHSVIPDHSERISVWDMASSQLQSLELQVMNPYTGDRYTLDVTSNGFEQQRKPLSDRCYRATCRAMMEGAKQVLRSMPGMHYAVSACNAKLAQIATLRA